MIMFYTASQLYTDPNIEVNFCGAMVKSRYLAILYLVLFFILSPGSCLPLLLGFLFGTSRKCYSEAKCFELSDDKAERLGTNCCCAWLTSLPNFIRPSEAGPDELPINSTNSSHAAFPRDDVPEFIPFRGAGQRLGGSSANRY
jgi:hypothetical protein